MKKKQINKLVNEAFNEETPDFLSKIKSECERTTQIEPVVVEEKKSLKVSLLFKKIAFCAFACMLFFSGFLIGNIEPKNTAPNKEASIYLDVNPSIEIQVDEDDNVIECIAGNSDGEKILENIILDGVDVDTALYAIVGSMYTNGYLNTTTNSILVSVDSENDNDEDLLSNISQQIDNVFKQNEEMNCSIIAQKIDYNADLHNNAKQYNISVGKMQLIDKIILKSDLYTDENIRELSEMSIHELDLVYNSIKDKTQNDDILSGEIEGYITDNVAIDNVLKYASINATDVESSNVAVLYHIDNGERKMIYLVTLVIKGQRDKQKYIVDCTNGEIIIGDTIHEWKDKLLDDGVFGKMNDRLNDSLGDSEILNPKK